MQRRVLHVKGTRELRTLATEMDVTKLLSPLLCKVAMATGLEELTQCARDSAAGLSWCC